MKKNQDQPAPPLPTVGATLRDAAEKRRVENQTKHQTPPDRGPRTEVEAARLVEELEIHEIELTMQNQQLQEAHVRVEEALGQYTDLYDFAPVAYLTFDRHGAIQRVNLTGTRLLGVDRSRLVNRRFGQFIASDDRGAFSLFLQRVFASEAKESCEVTLQQEGSEPLIVRIDGTSTEDGQECAAVVLNLTESREAERKLRAAYAETQRMLAMSDRARRALLSALEDRKQAEDGREHLLRQQTALNRITHSLGQLTVLPSILRTVHAEVRALLDADGFFVSRYHRDTGLITALYAVDEGREHDVSTFPPVPLAPEGRGMQSQVLRTGRPLNVPDWLEAERRMQTVHHIGPDGTLTPPPPPTERDDCTKSALLVPLMFRGETTGVLQVQSNRLNAYSDEDVDLLAGLANVAAVSIQNALLIEEAEHAASRLRLSLEGTLIAVSRASETRDPYTAGHQRRVTDLALAMARELDLPDDERETLHAAGLTHDIGKLGIPAEILSKPGALAPIEVALIHEHPQKAHAILADVPFPGPVAEVVLQHHERLDGSGYPRGLAGDQILQEARILAVADVVEAMASHRPYRPARGIDVALAEIEQNAGTLYDPEVSAACLRLFRNKGYTLPA